LDDATRTLWELAVATAMVRCGILPSPCDPSKGYLPPTAAVAADPQGTRKARRRYRKLWRRSLLREIRAFDALSPRQRRNLVGPVPYRGGTRWPEDPLFYVFSIVKGHDVGRQRPRRAGRSLRWLRVKSCPELRRELLRAAAELGLIEPRPPRFCPPC
jgi:hypothetical protein